MAAAAYRRGIRFLLQKAKQGILFIFCWLGRGVFHWLERHSHCNPFSCNSIFYICFPFSFFASYGYVLFQIESLLALRKIASTPQRATFLARERVAQTQLDLDGTCDTGPLQYS